MVSFNKFQCFVEDLAEKVHNLGSDTLKIALFNTAPNAADTHFDTSVDVRLEATSNAAEIAAGSGYSAGGATVTITSSAQSAGTYKLVGSDVVFTASGGSIATFRYAVLYNSSAGAGASTRPVIGWWDYGAAVNITDTNTFTVDLSATNGILQIT